MVQNSKQAVYWYTRAARQGHPLAQFNLACLHLNGEGEVAVDTLQAYVWFRLCLPVLQGGLKDYAQKEIEKLEETLTPEELKQAKEEIAAFRPKPKSLSPGSE